ncbi:MAG: nitroreductase family protein [Spirochaetota bacterium]
MKRDFTYDILPQIQTRWSGRALSSEKIDRETIMSLLEAARYAPSCFNEQPWLFVIADTADSLEKARSVLAPANRIWADKAPVLLTICAKRTFAMNGQENFWSRFDTGTAWGYLTLEAEKKGIIAHGMGGFDRDAAQQKMNIPAEYEVIAMAALGLPGSKKELPLELQEREEPGTRKKIEEIAVFGSF